jgi:hypothetical protein
MSAQDFYRNGFYRGWEMAMETILERVKDREAVETTITVARMFRDTGRDIWYEGSDREGFAEEVRVATGFDPSEVWTQDPSGYKFHCPGELYPAIYLSGRWPLGS